MKIIVAILCLIICLAIAFPASASVCRTYNSHQICILSIKRSAKNYWEYQADVSIDGVKGETAVYNCRDALMRYALRPCSANAKRPSG